MVSVFDILCLKILISRSNVILLLETLAKSQLLSSYVFTLQYFMHIWFLYFYKNHIFSIRSQIFTKFIFSKSLSHILSKYVIQFIGFYDSLCSYFLDLLSNWQRFYVYVVTKLFLFINMT